MKRLFRFLFVTLALLLGTVACRQPQPAPESVFTLIDGRNQSLQALRGQVTLVVFWATSCSACVAEMPLLAQTQQRYQARGYRTLAVAMSYDRIDYVRNFARSRQLPFEVAMDHKGQLAQSWQVRATPTSFLLNRQGQIVQRHVGLINAAQLHAAIEQALAQP
ncbi:MAG: TlpA disulfide reductase family protein [Brachymonas sp.]|nr:TlpA disulfide reductase family protein [Brachymonas sp.]